MNVERPVFFMCRFRQWWMTMMIMRFISFSFVFTFIIFAFGHLLPPYHPDPTSTCRLCSYNQNVFFFYVSSRLVFFFYLAYTCTGVYHTIRIQYINTKIHTISVFFWLVVYLCVASFSHAIQPSNKTKENLKRNYHKFVALGL